MTRILSLGQNNGITTMILNLAPLKSYHLDTLSSLNVSSRAKRIEVREIENEVVFKTQPPRKTTASITGSSIQRQPLRPLANTHNTHPHGTVQKGDKPAKAFSVYTDRVGNRPSAQRSSNVAQSIRIEKPANKRPFEHTTNARPSKLVRPSTIGNTGVELSAAKIEALIEQKVTEALSNRSLDQPALPSSNEISEAVQRRLEALERKIENGEAEEARAEGLRFLLLAKQHRTRGEDMSALRMYELAVPFFPDQEKLQRKIQSLRITIQAKRGEAANMSVHTEEESRKSLVNTSIIHAHASENPSEEKPEPQTKKRRTKIHRDSEEGFNGSDGMLPDDYVDDNSFSYKAIKGKKSDSKRTAKSTLRIFSDTRDVAGPPTPRTRYLLDIVNSRDVALIKGLSGVGAKKARDLVEFLELHDEDENTSMRSLQQLIAVPGLGKRSVERAYDGISALVV